MREGNDGVLMDGGRGGFKDDREAFPFLGGNGQRDSFEYVGGKLDGGLFEAAALTRTRAGRPVFLLGAQQYASHRCISQKGCNLACCVCFLDLAHILTS